MTNQRIERIVVVGAGAMGASYAGKFHTMDPTGVSLLASGPRAERLKAGGLVVNGTALFPRVITPDEVPEKTDFLLVAVKHQDLPGAILEMAPLVGEGTLILSVMNGIDSEERLISAFGEDKVLYAVAVGIDALREGNRVTYTRGGKLFFGEAQNRAPTQRVRRVQDLFERAGILSEVPPDMIRTLWWKFMINVGINQVSAVLGAPYGVFQRLEEARELTDAVMREVIALALAQRIALSEKDITDWNVFLAGLSAEGKTSMLQDIEAGRETEVEMLGGKVLALGERLSVPTPLNQALYRLIKVRERMGPARS